MDRPDVVRERCLHGLSPTLGARACADLPVGRRKRAIVVAAAWTGDARSARSTAAPRRPARRSTVS